MTTSLDDGRARPATAARDQMTGIVQSAKDAARSLVAAAVAARTGADRIGAARQAVLDAVGEATAGGYIVADDGSVSPTADAD